MKKLFKDINKILLIVFIFSLPVKAFAGRGPWGVVKKLTGKAFLLDGDHSSELVEGQHFYDFSEILTEEGAQIVFSDFFDHLYILSGEGHLKVLNRIVELRRGFFWVQALNSTSNEFSIQTANAYVNYKERGESILSFDPETGKSQLLVMKGVVSFGNLLHSELSLNVHEGQFSFVIPMENEGLPRNPTPVGFASYKKILSLFPGIRPLKNSKTELNAYEDLLLKEKKSNTRKLASIATEEESKDKKSSGSILYLRNSKTYDEQKKEEEFVLNYHKKRVSQFREIASMTKKKVIKKKKNKIVKIFSPRPLKKSPTQKSKKERIPASIPNMIKNEVQVPHIDSGTLFQSLSDEEKEQKRHPGEVQSLMKELKSIKQDYNKSY